MQTLRPIGCDSCFANRGFSGWLKLSDIFEAGSGDCRFKAILARFPLPKAKFKRSIYAPRANLTCEEPDALIRTQPVLPMAPGVAGRRAHDCVCHGKTTLFAALAAAAAGAVIGKCFGRHRATDFPSFPKEVEAAVPDGLDVHLVMDNDATQRTGKDREWLDRGRHWHVRFTPTSASWLNQVGRRLAEPARRKLQRGAHRSVAELEADIMSFIDTHNEKPKPCKRARCADETLASVRRSCLKMNEPGASEKA